jgi:hypothetical protein
MQNLADVSQCLLSSELVPGATVRVEYLGLGFLLANGEKPSDLPQINHGSGVITILD